VLNSLSQRARSMWTQRHPPASAFRTLGPARQALQGVGRLGSSKRPASQATAEPPQAHEHGCRCSSGSENIVR